jgi:hypothetical protein
MARKKFFDAKEIKAFIKREADTDYVEYGCWTENSFTLNPTFTASNNKCDDGWASSEPTGNGWTITGTLEEFNEATETMKSGQSLAAIAKSQEIVDVKLANPDGTYYRAGEARITSFQETANTGRPTAAVTFTGEGEVDIAPPTT